MSHLDQNSNIIKKKCNSPSYKEVIERHAIGKLYHFTDRDNMESIIKNGGLYSWSDCHKRGITITKPGGSDTSRSLDERDGLESYVRVSFTREHPMMYVAMGDGRITNPVILEIDTDVICWDDTKYADRNATKRGAQVGGRIDDFKAIHFDSVKKRKHFDLDANEQEFFQAEVLVKNFIPLSAITNISNLGFAMPSQPHLLQSKMAYTAQITRNNPTAFIFLVDNSASMTNETTFNGETMMLSEAVARIVNHQINELVLRCIKSTEVRRYYDIAVIGYGSQVYSGWNGVLEGRDFVTPEELKDNPYKTIKTKVEKRTRKGVELKDVEKVQWVEARHDGGSTRMHLAFRRAQELLSQWMADHSNEDCYPPTVIHITDGEYNGGTSRDEMIQLSNELKSMSTNDGNVLLFNVHVTSKGGESFAFPANKEEISGNHYAITLFDMSSLLPLRYNDAISAVRKDGVDKRRAAMAVNVDMSTLVQLMDIGTPTNINQQK
ncbi:MAG: DarT ssDNA thymidine ADP-ribosyltransferase family protein [Bacteroidales bacterium]